MPRPTAAPSKKAAGEDEGEHERQNSSGDSYTRKRVEKRCGIDFIIMNIPVEGVETLTRQERLRLHGRVPRPEPSSGLLAVGRGFRAAFALAQAGLAAVAVEAAAPVVEAAVQVLAAVRVRGAMGPARGASALVAAVAPSKPSSSE